MRSISTAVLILLVLSAAPTLSQQLNDEQRDSIMKAGIMLHDRGKYAEAIELYMRVFDDDSTSDFVNYEIAYSYSRMRKSKEALEFGQRALRYARSNFKIDCQMLVANCLDDAGRRDEAIAIYKSVMEAKPDSYLTPFNLALTYYRQQDVDSALHYSEKALQRNPRHPGSRILATEILAQSGRSTPAMMMGLRFLSVEPTGDRAKGALMVLQEMLFSQNQRRKDSSGKNINVINIGVSMAEGADSVWNVSNTAFSLFLSLKLADVDRTKPIPRETWAEVVETLSLSLSTLDANQLQQPYRGDVGFFNELSKSKHIETFVYWILQSYDTAEIQSWLKANADKVADLKVYLAER